MTRIDRRVFLLGAISSGSIGEVLAEEGQRFRRHFSNLLRPRLSFGEYGAGRDQLNTPLGTAITPDGSIVLVDHKNHRVQFRNLTNGDLVRNVGQRGVGDGEFTFPASISVDGDSVYIADKGNSRVVELATNGQQKRIVSIRRSDGSHTSPYYLDASSGEIVVIPYDENLIIHVDPSGSSREIPLPRLIDSLPFDPGGIKIAGDTILVSDAASGRIVQFDKGGSVKATASQWGSHPGLLAEPGGIALGTKHIFVADQVNHRIQVFDAKSLSFRYQWGRHPVHGHEGGGRLHYPGSIAVDMDETIAVVSEPLEHRCQVFDLRNLTSQPVEEVNENAWWEKPGRFHYGSKADSVEGMLIITEQDTHATLAFDVRGDTPTLIRKFGGFGTAFGRFVQPSSIFIDPTTNVVSISDRGNNRLQQFSYYQSSGPVLAAAIEQSSAIDLRTTLSSSNVPPGYDVSRVDPGPQLLLPSGERIVVDVAQGALLHIDSNYRLTRDPILLPKGPQGYHRKPVSAVLAPDSKSIYFVDPWAYQVIRTDLYGVEIASWGRPGPGEKEFLFPFGLTIDDDGNLFVSDTGKHCIKKFDPSGGFISEFGSYGVGDKQFYKPKGLAFDKIKKRLYVMDFGNHRAQAFDVNGNFLFAFGIGEQYVPAASKLLVSSPLFPAELATAMTWSATPGPIRTRITTIGREYTLEIGLPSRSASVATPLEFSVRIIREGIDVTSQADFRVGALMPSHGHGLPEEVSVTRRPEGIFVKNMRFSMPGDWQIEYFVGQQGVWRRAITDLNVK